jgi:hypothetical protein
MRMGTEPKFEERDPASGEILHLSPEADLVTK